MIAKFLDASTVSLLIGPPANNGIVEYELSNIFENVEAQLCWYLWYSAKNNLELDSGYIVSGYKKIK